MTSGEKKCLKLYWFFFFFNLFAVLCKRPGNIMMWVVMYSLNHRFASKCKYRHFITFAPCGDTEIGLQYRCEARGRRYLRNMDKYQGEINPLNTSVNVFQNLIFCNSNFSSALPVWNNTPCFLHLKC